MITFLLASALLGGTQETALTHCSTRMNRPVAKALLSSTSLEEATAFVKKVKVRTNCTASGKYSGFYSFEPTGGSVDSVRGVVAEVLIKEELQSAAALPAQPIQRQYSRPWFAATGRHVSINEMAACIADTNPSGVLNILRSDSTNASEVAAFSAINPTFEACLSAEFKLVGNRQVVRGALADALYQRVAAAASLHSRTERH